MAQKIYEYTTKGNKNVETFDSKGYVTLYRNGKFVYEHCFSTMGVRIEEQKLRMLFQQYNVGFKVTEKN